MKNRPAQSSMMLLVFSIMVITSLGINSAVAQSPSAQEVMNTMIEQYETNMEGIKNYTLVEQLNRRTFSFYYERHMVNGHPVYRVAENPLIDKMGGESGMSMNRYAFIRQLQSRARLTGTESVNGHSTYVVTANDLSGLALDMGEKMSPQSITFWIDTDQFIPRKMLMEGILSSVGEQRPFTMVITMSQYREAEGMLVPFQTTMQMKGVLTGEQGKQLSEAMKKMQERLKQLPEDQRKRMKRMMQNMGAMQGLSKGSIKMTMQVKEVRVNTGPPNDQ